MTTGSVSPQLVFPFPGFSVSSERQANWGERNGKSFQMAIVGIRPVISTNSVAQ